MLIKYCVFSNILKYSGILSSSVFCSRTGRVPKDHNILRKKTQYLMNTMYLKYEAKCFQFLSSFFWPNCHLAALRVNTDTPYRSLHSPCNWLWIWEWYNVCHYSGWARKCRLYWIDRMLNNRLEGENIHITNLQNFNNMLAWARSEQPYPSWNQKNKMRAKWMGAHPVLGKNGALSPAPSPLDKPLHIKLHL